MVGPFSGVLISMNFSRFFLLFLLFGVEGLAFSQLSKGIRFDSLNLNFAHFIYFQSNP